MAPRQQLQSLLESITEHVYFQPPPNLQMTYPCVVYSRDSADQKRADNTTYRFTQRYSVTVIDRDPDSSIPGQIAALPMCTYVNWFAVDGLNHDVFQLFF
jgi:hypothetical protein